MLLFNLILLFASLAFCEDVTLESLWGSELPYMGLNSFAHLPTTKCLIDTEATFDIGIIGVPFDTAVSYRPGARFGPRAIRLASSRQSMSRGFSTRANMNPFLETKVIDCNDMFVTPVDNRLALTQMTAGYQELLKRKTPSGGIPKLVTLGGDHSIVLPALRGLSSVHGKISLIHFDAHLDTWVPQPTAWQSLADDDSGIFTHGTMFWMASQEGLLSNGSCVHAGLRCRISGNDWSDYIADEQQGFRRIHSDDVMTKGPEGIVREILETIPHGSPVYISVDIDVLDPSVAPGTGTPEAGGWQTRELIKMIRGLEKLNIVGADVVEVSPSYDGTGESTALAASQVIYELITSMVKPTATESEVNEDFLSLHESL